MVLWCPDCICGIGYQCFLLDTEFFVIGWPACHGLMACYYSWGYGIFYHVIRFAVVHCHICYIYLVIKSLDCMWSCSLSIIMIGFCDCKTFGYTLIHYIRTKLVNISHDKYDSVHSDIRDFWWSFCVVVFSNMMKSFIWCMKNQCWQHLSSYIILYWVIKYQCMVV